MVFNTLIIDPYKSKLELIKFAKSITLAVILPNNKNRKFSFINDSFCPPLKISMIEKRPNSAKPKYIYEYMDAI